MSVEIFLFSSFLFEANVYVVRGMCVECILTG